MPILCSFLFLLLHETALQRPRTVILADDEDSQKSSDGDGNGSTASSKSNGGGSNVRGMILPFQPLTMTFHNVNYYVDMPKVGGL